MCPRAWRRDVKILNGLLPRMQHVCWCYPLHFRSSVRPALKTGGAAGIATASTVVDDAQQGCCTGAPVPPVPLGALVTSRDFTPLARRFAVNSRGKPLACPCSRKNERRKIGPRCQRIKVLHSGGTRARKANHAEFLGRNGRFCVPMPHGHAKAREHETPRSMGASGDVQAPFPCNSI